MSDEVRFERWMLSESDLESLTPVKARDLIVKCFYEAQRETFAVVKQRLGKESVSEGDLMNSVTGAVRMAFNSVGGDFTNPSKESLINVVQFLAKKAASWGTPQSIIDLHKGQINKILSML